MNKVNHILLSTLFFLFAMTTIGKPIEKIVLKDGSVLEGHIVSQVPGVKIKFFTESATIQLWGDCYTLGEEELKEVASLPEHWKTYIKEHKDIIKTKDGKQYASLNSISYKKEYNAIEGKNTLLSELDNGHISVLERGLYLKFIDANKKEYEIEYTNIDEIIKLQTDKNKKTGTADIIETSNGTYTGHITSQKIGEYIKIDQEDAKGILVISSMDIKSQAKKALNEEFPIFGQIEYLDKVITTNDSIYTGVITKQTVKDNGESSIIIQTTDDQEKTILTSEITLIEKVKHNAKAYLKSKSNASKAKETANNEIYVCEKLADVKLAKPFGEYYLLLDTITLTVAAEDNTIKIECNNNAYNKNLVLVPIDKTELKYEGNKSKYNVIKKANLKTSAISPNESDDSIPDLLVTKYEVKKGNTYALFSEKDWKYVLIKTE